MESSESKSLSSNDIELVEYTAPNGKKVKAYPTSYLISLYNMGIKILPTYSSALEFNTKDLFTEEEYAACSGANHGLRRLLYLNPKLWNPERIEKESWRFEGVRALPGRTYVYTNGKALGPYRLFILDIDSQNAYDKIKSLLEDDLILNTYVTKSRKEFGYHIYWFEDWNENDDCVHIETDDCKAGGEFELFTSAQYTQIAGQHRDDPGFRYRNVGCRNLKEAQVMVQNGLYNQILNLLSSLLLDPKDIDARRKAQKKYKDPFHRGRGRGRGEFAEKYYDSIKNIESLSLKEWQQVACATWALPFYGMETNNNISHYYHFSKAFIGTLVRQGVNEKSINAITGMLSKIKPHEHYTKEFWHTLCKDGISRFKSGSDLSGIPSLIKQIRKDSKYGDEESASKYVEELLEVVNATKKDRFTSKDNGLTELEQKKQRQEEGDRKLAEEYLSEKDVDFAFECVIKQAPYDRISILQLLHGMLSAFTKTPISHILSSLVPGAGKNYLIYITTTYIPEQYVILYNRLSDRALFHIAGDLFVSTFDYENGKGEIIEPIEGYLKELHNKAKKIQRKNKKAITQEDRDELYEIQDEIRNTYASAQKVIELDNIIQVFLDTPPESLWEALMSLISQDSARDQFYTFSERGDNEKMGAKTNRLRGAPTIISSGVVDDTKSARFGEKNRRLVHVNPDTSAKKIKHAIRATIDQRLGTPEEYDEDYVSREDIERSRHIFEAMIAKLKIHAKQFGFKDPGVYLPRAIRTAIQDSIKVSDGKVWSMTINERLLRYLSIITLERVDSRLRLVNEETGQSRILVTFSDLERTLQLMNRISSQIRPYVVSFYNDVILPTYDLYPDPNTATKQGKEVKELERGVTSKQIVAYLKENKKETIDRKVVVERYLKPLSNQGILNETKSEIDGRSNIYSPVDGFETGISSLFENDTDPRLSIIHPEYYPSINAIRKDLERLLSKIPRKTRYTPERRGIIKNSKGQVLDFADILAYLGNPEKCFKITSLQEEEKRFYGFNKSCLGSHFEYLDGKNCYDDVQNPTRSFENPNIVNDATIEQKSQTPEDRRKIQNTFDKIDPKTTLVAPLQNPLQTPQTVPNFPPIFQTPSLDIEALKIKVQTQVEARARIQIEISTQIPEFTNYAAFDCEWYREDLQSNIDAGRAGKIYCFCLINSQGHTIGLHLKDFNYQEEKFISAILDALKPYDALTGYAIIAKKKEHIRGSIDGDIEQLRKNCYNLGTEINNRFEAIISKVKLLDLHGIFSCGNTKAFLQAADNISYRGEGLHEVATACLGEGKLAGLKSPDVEILDSESQIQYCLQDAILCLNLAEKDSYKLLKIFYHLSKEIGQDFFSTCNYAKPTSWWRSKLALLGYQKITGNAAMWQAEHIIRDSTGRPKNGIPYTGGKVFEPLVGLHIDVVTYDVGSMYPTMGNIKNISSETINCDCCKTDLGAKIPDDVMKLINDDLVKDGRKPRPWHYWICKRRRGILAEIMEDLFNKKSEYKKRGLSLEEKAVKLFANSGYGAFGQVNFEYYDFRVAELITGFARHTLIGLEQLLRDNGFQILYGDTDSLFVKNINNVDSNNITLMAKEKYGVEFSEDKKWKVLLLLKEKKQYFGVLKNGKLVYKTLLGLKNSYPSFFNEIIKNLISKDIITSQDSSSDRNLRVSNKIRAAFWEMNDAISTRSMEFIVEELAYSMKSVKALYEFADSNRNCWQKYIFDEKLEDYNGDQGLAEMNSQGKTVYRFWKILPPHNGKGSKDKTRKSCTMHPEKYLIDANAYRRDLWTCIMPILGAYGSTDNDHNKLKKELVDNQEELL